LAISPPRETEQKQWLGIHFLGFWAVMVVIQRSGEGNNPVAELARD
jgi:hypothetical protein